MIPRRADGCPVGSYKRQRMETGVTYGGQGSFYRGSGASHYYGLQNRTPFPVVRLRGLPFNCTEADVFEFFPGLDIVDILFVKKHDLFSGEAFVVLGIYLHVELAVQRDRQNMGRRYVEVFRCRKQDYYQAVAAEVNQKTNSREDSDEKKNTKHSGVLRLRGLPFSATKSDIVDFFEGFLVSEENVHIVKNSEGRATGEAFVEFGSAKDSKRAMRKDKEMIGNRYVELFPSTVEETAMAASK